MANHAGTPEVNYQLEDLEETQKTLHAYAQLQADTYRVKTKVTNPGMPPEELEKQCHQQEKAALEDLTRSMKWQLSEFNNAINQSAAEGNQIGIEVVQGERIILDSQANVDHALKEILEDGMSDYTRKMHYYNKRLDMMGELQAREDRKKAGKPLPLDYSDLDMARLDGLNREIVMAGEQVDIPKHELAIDQYNYELRAYAGKPKDTLGEAESRIALLKTWVQEEEKARTAEQKTTEDERKEPAAPEKKDTGPADTLPPPVDITPKDLPPKPPLGLIQSAKKEVVAILAGQSSFSSEFNSLKVSAKAATKTLPPQ